MRKFIRNEDGSLGAVNMEVTDKGTLVVPVQYGGLVEKEGLEPEEIEAAIETKKKEVINALVTDLLEHEYIKIEIVNKVSGITGVKCSILVGVREDKDE